MRYLTEPENFEKMSEVISVIDHDGIRAIAQDDDREYFFAVIEENFAPPGTVAEKDLFLPIKNLPEKEQQEILLYIQNHTITMED